MLVTYSMYIYKKYVYVYVYIYIRTVYMEVNMFANVIVGQRPGSLDW